MNAIRLFAQLLGHAPTRHVALLLLLMVASSLSEGIGILLLVPLLELLQGTPNSGSGLVQLLSKALLTIGIPISMGGLLLSFLLLVGCTSAIQHARNVLATRLQFALVDQLRERCFAGLLHAEWRWLAMGSKSNHANLLLTDVTRVGIGLHFGLGLLAALASMGAYLFAALALSWQITALAIVTGSLVFWALSGQRRHALKLGNTLGHANQTLQHTIQESLAGLKLTKILGNEQQHLDVFVQSTGQLRQQQLDFQLSSSLSRALFQFGGVALLCCYLYLGLQHLQVALPELLTLVLVFARLIPMFNMAQQHVHHWLHALPAVSETQQLLLDCQAAAEPNAHGDTKPWPINHDIRLEQARIHYPGRAEPALLDINLRFPVRTTTAIMGASGAGKSTLADVLMGLLSLDHGTLTVDGVPIQDTARMRWRHSVAYVPQEVFLFHDSIRQNLLWGQAQASESELRQALERAAAEFVFKLPQGLDTIVGDGGVRLSGGERQRIALARALLKQPTLLILDEATSALDKDNEARIRAAIEHLHGDLTVVIIGHRLPTLEHADQVIIMHNGQVHAQGNWQQIKHLHLTAL